MALIVSSRCETSDQRASSVTRYTTREVTRVVDVPKVVTREVDITRELEVVRIVTREVPKVIDSQRIVTRVVEIIDGTPTTPTPTPLPTRTPAPPTATPQPSTPTPSLDVERCELWRDYGVELTTLGTGLIEILVEETHLLAEAYENPPVIWTEEWQAKVRASLTESDFSARTILRRKAPDQFERLTRPIDTVVRSLLERNAAIRNAFDNPESAEDWEEFEPELLKVTGLAQDLYDAQIEEVVVQAQVCGTFDEIFQTDPSPTPVPTPTSNTSVPESSKGFSRSNPLPAGTSINDGLTVASVLKAERGWNRYKEVNRNNDAPADGFEYLLVTLEVTYTGHQDSVLRGRDMDLRVVGKHAKVYAPPPVVVENESYEFEVFGGGSFVFDEVFEVSEDDSEFVLIYESGATYPRNTKLPDSCRPNCPPVVYLSLGTPTTAPTPTPTITPTPTPTLTTTPTVPWVGNGTHLVGTDIQPGTYRTEVNSDEGQCYWARWRATDGKLTSIIASNLAWDGPMYVTILPTDVAFESTGNGCTGWELWDGSKSETPSRTPLATQSPIPADEALPMIVVGPEFERELTEVQRQVIADSLSIGIEDVPDFDQATRLFEGRNAGVELIATLEHTGIYTFTFVTPSGAPVEFKSIDPGKPIRFFGIFCPQVAWCDAKFQDITDTFFFDNLQLIDGTGNMPLAMSFGVSIPQGGSLDVMVIAYYVDDTLQETQ